MLDKILKYLPEKDKLKIKVFLNKLHNTQDPFADAKKLTWHDTLYRYKVYNYRILCHISNGDLVVILVIDIAQRKSIYKRL